MRNVVVMNVDTALWAVRQEWIGLAVLALARVVYTRDLTVLKLAVPSFRADFRPSSFQLLRLSCAGSDRDMFEQHLVQTLIKYLGEATLAFVTVTLHDMGGPDVCQVTGEPAGHPVYLQ